MARPAILRRSPHDREILRLALPAFGALAAEPLYILADTAIVGRLGTLPLAGLGVAGSILTGVLSLFNFLAYGTTSAVARRLGAGDERGAVERGVAGLWLALVLGLALVALGLLLAPAVVDAMGTSDAVRPYALTYVRISLLGAPSVLVAAAAIGYLRGAQDTRTPLVVAVAANLANLGLEVLLVYGLDLGIAGSAWGTVIAQAASATAFLFVVGRTVRRAHASVRPVPDHVRHALVVGGHLVVRTGSLLVTFLVATAVATRIGDVEIAAHQIAWQLWFFLALSLDAIAIAGQAIVGRYLGAGDERATRATARRMVEWGVMAGVVFALIVVAVQPALVRAFTDDPAVRHELRRLLYAVALIQPFAGAVFVIDGILIGAGESRYLAYAMAGATLAFLPLALLVVVTERGLIALWAALYVFIFARLYGTGRRYLGDAWLVTGSVRE